MGNWALAPAAYMAFPDLRSVFNQVKKLGDFVEAWTTHSESQVPPPYWADFVFGYITLMAKLPTLSSKASYESLDWKFTPRDLVEWARRHSVEQQIKGEASDPNLLVQGTIKPQGAALGLFCASWPPQGWESQGSEPATLSDESSCPDYHREVH